MIECVSDLRLFLAIGRTLNFRAAGEQFGYSPAVVTTRMQRLEAMTGTTLFIRSTRHIRLTDDGQRLIAMAEQVVELAERMSGATRAAVADEADLEGFVRLSAPHSFARVFLLEPIAGLLREHPELCIELLLDDGLTPLVKEGIDISFRVGGKIEPNVDSYDLLVDRRILVASPAYLAEKGTPETPQALREHRCLSYSNLRTWTLQRGARSVRVPLQIATCCNTGDYLSLLAQADAGITVKSWWSVQAELDAGKLVRVLPDYCFGADHPVRALLPSRDYLPRRVSHVLEVIRRHIDATVHRSPCPI